MKRTFTLLLAIVAFAIGAVAQTFNTDAAMSSVSVPAYSEFGKVSMMAVFRNAGTDTLKSLTLNWRLNSGTVTSIEKTGLTLVRNQSWPFISPDSLTINQQGKVVLKVWTSRPNGIEDQNHSNDTVTQIIQVISKYPEKHILIEEVTGAWCGYCPRAPIIYQTNIKPAYPKTIFTAIHTGDAMAITDSREFTNLYVTGVPCGFVDRKKTSLDAGISFSPEEWSPLLGKIDNKFTPVDLHVYNYYEPATKNWKIDVVADFVFDMTGDYRMNCYILEDSLYGTGSSWEQRNFFNGGASEPYMSLQGAGDPIPGYKHHHVVRKMLGGSWGASGIIPAAAKMGERYVYSQTFKADAKWNMSNVHIVGIVQQYNSDKNKRAIVNCVEGEVELLTGTDSQELNTGLRIYPNPAAGMLWIELPANGSTDSKIEIINALGQEVYAKQIPSASGESTLPVSLSGFSKGVYFVRLVNSGKVFVERLVKE